MDGRTVLFCLALCLLVFGVWRGLSALAVAGAGPPPCVVVFAGQCVATPTPARR